MPEAAAEQISLVANGVAYAGWKETAVTRSIECIAGSFDVRLSEIVDSKTQRRKIDAGDACAVKLGDETVITGFVDDPDFYIDEGAHDIQVTGRDVTGDLVDCSAINSPGEWRNRDALQIIKALCEGFSIPATATVPLGAKFPSFKLQEGETVFEAIDRICKARALLPMSDGKGGLVLMRSGSNAQKIDAPLVYGQNIKTARTHFSMAERFSQIRVKGQQTQLDGMTPSEASSPSALATDPTVPRFRPLVVISDEEGDGVTLDDRAKWEVNVRAGRARSADVTVWGWRNKTGALWQPNTIVPVYISILGIEQDMLITTTCHQYGDSGRLTSLRLAHPKSFDLLAVEKAKTKGGSKGDALIGTPKYVGSELVKAKS